MYSAMILTGPSPASRFSPAKEQSAIRALRQAHNRALAAQDMEGVVGLSTDDFVMIVGGSGQIIQGKAAYRDFVATIFADPHPFLFVRTPDRIDVGVPDAFPVAAETGRWTGTAAAGGAPRITGRYLVHWTRTSGAWRIASETYVTVE